MEIETKEERAQGFPIDATPRGGVFFVDGVFYLMVGTTIGTDSLGQRIPRQLRAVNLKTGESKVFSHTKLVQRVKGRFVVEEIE